MPVEKGAGLIDGAFPLLPDLDCSGQARLGAGSFTFWPLLGALGPGLLINIPSRYTVVKRFRKSDLLALVLPLAGAGSTVPVGYSGGFDAALRFPLLAPEAEGLVGPSDDPLGEPNGKFIMERK